MEGDWGMELEALEDERRDADIEMHEMYVAGRDMARRQKKSARLRAEGKLSEAAAVCPHESTVGYPSPWSIKRGAANTDPRWNERGARCRDCGSWLSVSDDWDFDVIAPCEVDPETL